MTTKTSDNYSLADCVMALQLAELMWDSDASMYDIEWLRLQAIMRLRELAG